MKYIVLTFLVFAAAPLLAAAEVVTNFTADYTLEADATVEVVETIEYDFGSMSRHGIYRDLSTKHAQPATAWYKTRSVDIAIQQVLRDGIPEPFTVQKSGDNVEIKIGDADRTVTGNHTYTIAYTLTGALSYGPSGSEFYWNVTGTDWPVTIERVQAILHDPDELFLPQRACYTGATGASTACVMGAAADSAVTFTAQSLSPGNGITIAQEVRADEVANVIVERVPFGFWFIPLLLTGVIALIYRLFRLFTKHRPNVPIIAEYEPYPGALPMYTGVLIDGQLDPKDITAGLLYLAEQGFIKIKKTDRKVLFLFNVEDYDVELLKPLDATVTEFQQTALTLLFPTLIVGEVQSLSELKSSTSRQRSNYKILQSLKTAIAADLMAQGFFEKVLLLARRRTTKGYEAMNHLKGFKEFLSVTDKDRFAFHNAPAKNPETFMQYLPYAVAFGVEKEWAELFKDIAIPTPEWYEGGNVGTFNAVALTHDLGAFSTAFSSSSGTTGSSGGGSVGGGGGGGGGGSW